MTPIAILFCLVTHVVDADTIKCSEGYNIRIYGIDSPEVRTTAGDAAKAWATEQWLGINVVCEITGTSFSRLVGTCARIGTNLASEALDAGHAVDVCGVAKPPRYC